jgi:hypothetical protein
LSFAAPFAGDAAVCATPVSAKNLISEQSFVENYITSAGLVKPLFENFPEIFSRLDSGRQSGRLTFTE